MNTKHEWASHKLKQKVLRARRKMGQERLVLKWEVTSQRGKPDKTKLVGFRFESFRRFG